MGLVAVGFLAFSLLTSNPFERLLPNTPLDGNDLNPLLQDPGLIIHPLLLYMGYVGLSVPFAFAIAALLGGRLDASGRAGRVPGPMWSGVSCLWGSCWAAGGPTKSWAGVDGGFGILSRMPHLCLGSWARPWCTVLLSRKSGKVRSWTVLLAIFAFSLSLLEHVPRPLRRFDQCSPFGQIRARPVYSDFSRLVVGGSLLLYAMRAPAVASRVSYAAISRESLLMVNNLSVHRGDGGCAAVGTLFPLVMDAFSFGKYSVGPPYFNAVFVPLMALVMPFAAVGPLSRWRGRIPRIAGSMSCWSRVWRWCCWR